MRYRIHIKEHETIEVECYRFKMHKNRIFKAWAEGAKSSIDIHLPGIPEKICDDRGREVEKWYGLVKLQEEN